MVDEEVTYNLKHCTKNKNGNGKCHRLCILVLNRTEKRRKLDSKNIRYIIG